MAIHALLRLQQRHLPDATVSDLVAIKHAIARGEGALVTAARNGMVYDIDCRGVPIRVVMSPDGENVLTVLAQEAGATRSKATKGKKQLQFHGREQREAHHVAQGRRKQARSRQAEVDAQEQAADWQGDGDDE